MSNPAILELFPTEKYKRFWYPTRPLFTLALGLFLASLGLIGIVPMSVALWLSASLAFDDLPLTPIMAVITAVNNLYHGRKQTKAWVMLICVSLATICGGLLGFYVLSQLPAFMAAVSSFIAATSCSPLLISIFAISGSLIAHATDKISPFVGTAIGILVASFIPPAVVPLMLETTFICASGLAFVVSIAAKQSLRAYHHFRYGHTNADGYQINRDPSDQEQFIKAQANKFNVSVEEFERVTHFCKNEIEKIKTDATLIEEFGGTRQPKSNAHKDIYHGLMNPKADKDTVIELLRKSTPNMVRTADPRRHQTAVMLVTTSSGQLRSDKRSRTFFHQASVYPGVPDSLVQPFQSQART